MSRTTWHPAFIEAIQLEFGEYQDDLVFESEHPLTAEPLKIDVLIIKKRPEAVIDKNIGTIFRNYNVIEYKSPNDYASINDYHKAQIYARLYAVQNHVDIDGMSVSLVVTKPPRKLLNYLSKRFTLTKYQAGIYFVEGDTSPTQIVVSEELSEAENLWLKNLNNELTSARMVRFLDAAEKLGKEASVGAYFDVIAKTNSEILLDLMEKKMRKTFEQLLVERGLTAHIEAAAKASGKTEAVVTVLRTRFGTVPKTIQASIKSYSDLTALDSLLESAVTCASISEFRQNLVR